MAGREIVARARALLGVRFRLQGRDPDVGLDCIGVVAMAMRIPKERLRHDYGLHCVDPEVINREFDEAGFVRIAPGSAREGDVVVVRPSPIGLHVIILTEAGYLHADAGLRRVVEVPGRPPWPALSAWRHDEEAAKDPLAPELVGPTGSRH